MLYLLLCEDRAGAEEVRMANRSDHLAYVQKHVSQIRFAGPFLDESGERMRGSMLVIEAASLADAESFSQNDPYRRADLFDRVLIRPFRQVVPAEETS